MAVRFETFVVRRRTKTQKYKGVIFEQFERVWAFNYTRQQNKKENKTQGSEQGT